MPDIHFLSSEVIFPLWILGEPTFLYALFLVEYFFDGPEGGEGKNTE